MTEPSANSQQSFDMSASYASRLPIAPLPDNDEFAPGSTHLARIGPISIYRAGWGVYIDSRAIAEAATQSGFSLDLAATIEKLGFSGGYHFPIDSDTFSTRVQNLMTGYITRLVERVMEARGWDSVDALFVGTQTILEETLDDVRAALRRKGKQVGPIYWYRMACNSATAALADTLREPAFAGQRVAVVGLDTLSGNTTDSTDPVTFATFGNGGAAMAYVPGKEIEVLAGETVVEYDTDGFFNVPHIVNRRPKAQPRSLPADYRVLGEETKRRFHATENGLFLEIPGDETFRMDGRGTFRYFTSTGVTELLWNVMETYRQKFSQSLGKLGATIGHQPSQAVVDGLNRTLFRIALENRSQESQEAGGEEAALSTKDIRKLMRADISERLAYLRKLGIDALSLNIPWVMPDAGFNNISAGTSLSALTTLAAQKVVMPGTAHVLLGLGVGASYQAHAIRFVTEG